MNVLVKPKFRGTSHLWAFFISAGLSAFLIWKASGARQTGAAVIYSLSLVLMFGLSALYHVPTWAPRPRRWLRRLDHATIFILIAGSYAPVCLLVLDPTSGSVFLKVVWGVAAVGIMQSLFWIRAPKIISISIYIALGWLVLPLLSEIKSAVGTTTLIYILLSGFLYSLGAAIYAFKKPNPWPTTFGYHEIFHALVIFASASYFLAVLRMLNI